MFKGHWASRLHTATEWAAEIEERNRYEWREKPTPAELGYRGAVSYLNGFEDGGSWDRKFEVYTDYRVQPEGYPPGVQEKAGFTTEYWEIVTADAGPVTQTLREHFGSFCNESETRRQLERLQLAQHRARHILAIKEIERIGGDGAPACIAYLKANLLHPAS